MEGKQLQNSRSRLALTLLLLSVSALYAVFIARTEFRVGGRHFFTLVDDAMISMRYAQHLAQGQGLVWNIGESPIQGFTNPGWVLVMAILHVLRLPQSNIALALMAVSAAILIANTVVIQQIYQHLAPSARFTPLLAPAVTALYYPLVFWSLRGMEVGLLVLLVDAAVLTALRHKAAADGPGMGLGLLLSVAVLVRLDAIVQAAVVIAYLLANQRAGIRNAVLPGAMVTATLIAILVCQWAYFGDVLPNTYYLKMAGGAIAERLRHGVLVLLQYALRDLAIPSLVVAFGIWRFRELRTPETMLLAGLFAVQCMYSIWVGGDYAEPEVDSANRFIAQGVPALIMLFALVLEKGLAGEARAVAGTFPSWPVGILVGAIALLAASGVPWYRWIGDNAPLLQSDIRRVRAGLSIAAHTSPDAVIAVHAAGQIPYFSQRRTIDLLGLNDPIIAHGPRRTAFYPGHDKWDYDYSIGLLKPDLIADNWIRLADYVRQRSDYRKLANGMYVRADTTLVDVVGLEGAFP